MNIKLLEERKAFRELPEQYRTDKFIALYYKMYEYMLSVPKEKIVISKIVKRNVYAEYLFGYISHFIEAKDFYKWKERIYSLMTEKLSSTDYRKFKLLYESKAKEFFNKYMKKQENTFLEKYKVKNPQQSKEIQEKSKATCLEIYGYENPMQSKEVQDKVSNTWKNKSKEEIENIIDKRKDTCTHTLGVDNPMHSKEIVNKIKDNWKNKTKEEIDNIIDKREETNLLKYNSKYYFGKYQKGHSKEADEFCKLLDTLYGTLESEDTRYFTKNGELYFRTNKGYLRFYDFMNTKEKWGVEYDCVYWHALDKDDNDIIKFPGGKLVLAKEIHKRDKEKEELAIQNGYKVFHIRDDDYKSNKSKCLENLLKEIKNYVHSLENRI